MAENNRTLAIGMGYHSNKLLPLPFRKVSAADLLACLNCYPVLQELRKKIRHRLDNQEKNHYDYIVYKKRL